MNENDKQLAFAHFFEESAMKFEYEAGAAIHQQEIDTLDGTTHKMKKSRIFRPDYLVGPDEQELILGTVTEHQRHACYVHTDTHRGKIVLTFEEIWWDGSHRGKRQLTFRKLVHLLMNITDDEIEEIASRDD